MHPTIVNPGSIWVQPGFIVCLYQFVSEWGTSDYNYEQFRKGYGLVAICGVSRGGIRLQEAVDGFRLVDLARIKDTLRKIGKVDAVREILRLKTQSTAGTVMGSAFSCL